MSESWATVESRIENGLNRLGYHDVSVVALSEGRIQLEGNVEFEEDHAIVVQAVRCVPGVRVVCTNLQTVKFETGR